jgi:magnesium transporter
VSVDERIATAFVADHPDDAARVLDDASPGDCAALLASLPPAVAAGVFRAIAPSPAAACAAALGDEQLAAMLDVLPLDTAAATLRGLPQGRREALVSRLEEERAEHLRAVLAYPEKSAGAIADPLALALPDDITVAEAQKLIRGSPQRLLYYVYVVRRDRTLVGVVAIPELMAARPKEALVDVMRRDLVRLDAQTDMATVAAHPAWRELDALPVVDAAGRLIGAIRHKTMRRMMVETARPMMATIVGLSELYWVGLSGMLATIARPRSVDEPPPGGEASHVP